VRGIFEQVLSCLFYVGAAGMGGVGKQAVGWQEVEKKDWLCAALENVGMNCSTGWVFVRYDLSAMGTAYRGKVFRHLRGGMGTRMTRVGRKRADGGQAACCHPTWWRF